MSIPGHYGSARILPQQRAFFRISKSCPVENARSRDKNRRCISVVQSILLGSAGLLPSQRADSNAESLHDSYIEKLESVWLDSNFQSALPLSSWQFFKVRPGITRCGVSSYEHLIVSYRDAGLLQGLTELVRYNRAEIGTALKVPVEGYWVNRFDFGKKCYGLGCELIGRARASEIVINVLLPFVYALELQK